MISRRAVICVASAAVAQRVLHAGLGTKDAKYIGGTLQIPQDAEGKFDVTDEKTAAFNSKKGNISIPYDRITSIEYGQKAGRRVGVALVVSPIALFSKKRRHFLSLTYKDAAGKDQGVVIELGKDIVRTTLKILETRSGKAVEFESEDAKKNLGG
jgi:hypothetical protein